MSIIKTHTDYSYRGTPWLDCKFGLENGYIYNCNLKAIRLHKFWNHVCTVLMLRTYVLMTTKLSLLQIYAFITTYILSATLLWDRSWKCWNKFEAYKTEVASKHIALTFTHINKQTRLEELSFMLSLSFVITGSPISTPWCKNSVADLTLMLASVSQCFDDIYLEL